MFRTIPTVFPNSVLIETYNICNGRCTFCPYRVYRKDIQPQFLSFEVIKKLIDEISCHCNVKRITLFNNNEPLLDGRIANIISYASNKCPSVELTLSTNGRLYSPEIAGKLFNAGLNTLYISIPSLDNNEYYKLMNFDLSRILEALNNTDGIIRESMLRIAVPITYAYDKQLFDSYFSKLSIRVSSWELEYKEEWGCFDVNALSRRNHPIQREKSCDRPMDQAVILSNGNMVLCCRDWEEKTVIGNVINQTIESLWRGSTMKSYQDRIACMDYSSIDLCSTCSERSIG